MIQISDRELTLFDLDQYERSAQVQWGWLDRDNTELGTKKILVPNSPTSELGTKKILVPNSDQWTPPVGCLQQKWVKDHKYWYWRYYNLKGKKASLYLAKDYNKAISKAQKIGVPTDAKPLKHRATPPDPQTQTT